MKTNYKILKTLLVPALLACTTCLMAQSTVTVKFTGETETGRYAQLHHVVIQNLTKGWEETVFYPDTVMTLTDPDGVADQIFTQENLAQNYPNPFNGNTMLNINLLKPSHVTLQVFDLNGRLCTSYCGNLKSGEFQFEITLSAPQAYLAKVTTDYGSACVRMLNMERGDANNVVLHSDGFSRISDRKTRTVFDNPFDLGDEMCYIGFVDDMTSDTVEQQQLNDATVVFVFPESGSNGVLPGIFSVSPSLQVNFSQGNLRYNASSDVWRFAENQYDHVGDANANISSSYDGWIDLFGWGTSNRDHGAICYQPWSVSTNTSDYYAYGTPNANLYDNDGTADWGVNDIENGGLPATENWRTLTYDEWEYLLNGRPDADNKHGHGTVCGQQGMLFLPDSFVLPEGCAFTAGVQSGYETNVYDESSWEKMEAAGVLFLPTTGIRIGTMIGFVNADGGYWSSSSIGNENAYYLNFASGTYIVNNGVRMYGECVRLVKDRQ